MLTPRQSEFSVGSLLFIITKRQVNITHSRNWTKPVYSSICVNKDIDEQTADKFCFDDVNTKCELVNKINKLLTK